jgi:putative ABC transport system ATP-binding protein
MPFFGRSKAPPEASESPHASAEAGSTVLELQHVSKVYRLGEGDVFALRDVSLSIRKGEMVAIMGSSGSGKSTCLNLLGTLDRPTEGRYLLEGVPTETMEDDELAELRNRRIGFVFQSFHLLPRETAVRNVELPLVYRGVSPKERRKRALAALEKVGLGERSFHLPAQLSGGQQQRVSIARALAAEPAVLLADEPTGALDSATSRQVMELFVELHAQGMTVVLVTHDDGVAAYAERVVTFRDGNIVSDVARTPIVAASAVAHAVPHAAAARPSGASPAAPAHESPSLDAPALDAPGLETLA